MEVEYKNKIYKLNDIILNKDYIHICFNVYDFTLYYEYDIIKNKIYFTYEYFNLDEEDIDYIYDNIDDYLEVADMLYREYTGINFNYPEESKLIIYP